MDYENFLNKDILIALGVARFEGGRRSSKPSAGC